VTVVRLRVCRVVFVRSPPGQGLEQMLCQPHNKQLQRTVEHKVPRHIGQRAAAELRR